MRVLICGGRNWKDKAMIVAELKALNRVEVVIEGECRGADRLGKSAAIQLNIPVLPCPADWTKYGKSAGSIRNRQMLNEGKPDLVLAFHDNIDESKGTRNMMEIASNDGIEVRLFAH